VANCADIASGQNALLLELHLPKCPKTSQQITNNNVVFQLLKSNAAIRNIIQELYHLISQHLTTKFQKNFFIFLFSFLFSLSISLPLTHTTHSKLNTHTERKRVSASIHFIFMLKHIEKQGLHYLTLGSSMSCKVLDVIGPGEETTSIAVGAMSTAKTLVEAFCRTTSTKNDGSWYLSFEQGPEKRRVVLSDDVLVNDLANIWSSGVLRIYRAVDDAEERAFVEAHVRNTIHRLRERRIGVSHAIEDIAIFHSRFVFRFYNICLNTFIVRRNEDEEAHLKTIIDYLSQKYITFKGEVIDYLRLIVQSRKSPGLIQSVESLIGNPHFDHYFVDLV
jgi:hypothetical protein